MAALTKAEKQLMRLVADQDLHANLLSLRRAAERIWSEESPRIIPGYTFHGLSHSQRLVDYAVKLLAAHDGGKLTEREAYLLLAGIYLHDIGMQCDVVRWPEIKARAEGLGAKFEPEIKATNATNYGIEEQKLIRSNHHLLSAAWIDHASRTGETVLGPAAKGIPPELVDDLMDICKHHTKLPITECPLTFKRDPNERKQFIAALLRFADELDIDDNRVSIDTVKNFNLDPQNSVYWWLHHSVKVIFSARSVVILNIWLHPDDFKEHGAFIRTAFITEFRSKNQAVLSVLGKNGIPIIIDDDSKVEEDDRIEPLPSDIVAALRLLQKPRERQAALSKEALADEIRIWLRAIRYEVSEPERRNDRITDMIATLDQGTVRQRVLVRCVEGEIRADDVVELNQVLDRKTPQGWLISDKRVSPGAINRAAEDDAFSVFTLAQFLHQKVWAPYIDALTSLVEQASIPELYIDLACYKQDMDEQGREKGRDRYASLDAYIDSWLTERGKVHISILGEFGTGKTWFCRHYAYRQLHRYLDDPAGERMPLLITLRAFAKAMTAQQLINDALLEQYKLPFVGGAFEVFQEMNRRGKLLLILDGFDEMARQVDYQTVVDNFWELAKLVEDGSKVILTSRTEYFRWAEESEKVLSGQEFGRRTIVLQPPRFEVLYLEPFTDEQIRSVIIGRKGEQEGPAVADRILSNQNLAEMARKPVLIELLMAALDEVSADVLENQAEVYLYATDKLLLRNITAEKTFTSTADKLYFLCELAWEMIKSGELRIHYTVIPERIKSYFGDKIKDQHELDTWDFDLRNQTLLHRDAAGYYEFAHKSLAEYFVAFKFAAELGCLAPKFAQTYTEAAGKVCEVPIRKKSLLELTETFGIMKLTDERMKAIDGMLGRMITKDRANNLWEVVLDTQRKTVEQVKYTGGNAITLLRKLEESFINTDLSYTIIFGADLRNANLEGANIQYSNVNNVDMSECSLSGSDFQWAKFNDIHFNETNYVATSILDDKGILAISSDGNIKIYSIDDQKRLATLRPAYPYNETIIACLHPDGKYVAGGGEGWIKIWDIETQKELMNLGSDYPVSSSPFVWPAFHPDGKHIAGGGRGWIKIWNIDTGEEKANFQIERYNDDSLFCAFHPDGKQIAGGGRGWIKIWDIDTGEEKANFQVEGHDNVSLFCTFHPDGKRIATSCEDRILIWDIENHKKLSEIEFPGGRLGTQTCPIFHESGKLIVGGDGGVLIIDVDTRSIKQETDIDLSIYSANIITIGRKLIAASLENNDIVIIDIQAGYVVKTIQVKTDCSEMRISNAQFSSTSGESDNPHSLLEFFADRGAILDEEQQRTLAELRRKRAEDEQRQAAKEAAAEPPKKPRARRKKPAVAE